MEISRLRNLHCFPFLKAGKMFFRANSFTVSGLISRITATCLLLSNSSSLSSIEFLPSNFQMRGGQKSVLSNKVTLGCQGNWSKLQCCLANLCVHSILPAFFPSSNIDTREYSALSGNERECAGFSSLAPWMEFL